MAAKLDVIIFGASGFTGKYTVYESVKVLSNFTWGIAGRNQEKLETVLKEMGKRADTDLSKIPITIADLKDEQSLKEMAAKCKIVVNCSGPYRFYGEPVVKACIESGTHHVDVSGEPQFMETMQLKYDSLAKEKGVYVISACGFDSIPTDLGISYLQSKFNGVVNSVETYLTTEQPSNMGGASLHYGTWESAVYGLAHANELKGIRTQLFKERLPEMKPKLKSRFIVHKRNFVKDWYLPFLGSDRAVVNRSQRFFYENENKRPVQMRAYFGVANPLYIGLLFFVGAIFSILTRFSIGRKLLLTFPRLFSFGFASHEGPAEEKMDKTKFSVTIYGEGWEKSNDIVDETEDFKEPPTKHLIAKVSGTNPGYGATCVALLISARTILTESDKMPGNGGVLPPAAAFSKTNMITELSNNGFTFEVLNSDTKKEQ